MSNQAPSVGVAAPPPTQVKLKAKAKAVEEPALPDGLGFTTVVLMHSGVVSHYFHMLRCYPGTHLL